MIVSYSTWEETIICSVEDEEEILENYFKDTGRKLEDYNRVETKAITILSTNNVTPW